jgi:hypothetical protein
MRFRRTRGAKERQIDSTEAFRKAIDEAGRSSGGVVPEGVFLTGAIHEGNINLVVRRAPP